MIYIDVPINLFGEFIQEVIIDREFDCVHQITPIGIESSECDLPQVNIERDLHTKLIEFSGAESDGITEFPNIIHVKQFGAPFD